MQWFIGPEPPSEVQGERFLYEPVQIDELLELFKESQDKFFEKCSVSKDQIAWLAENSNEQRKSN